MGGVDRHCAQEGTKQEMNLSEEEIRQGQRFAFGANWARFLRGLNDDRIRIAQESLTQMLEVEDLKGKSFLDVGSGSGLFSLAARRLGARVRSFDYDAQSVACTAEMKRRYFPGEPEWVVEQGSVLDRDYLERLGTFDVVYAWGVLHHTGAMWRALDNVARLVAVGGRLFIAIYNDQGRGSRRWAAIKRAYNRYKGLRPLLLGYGLARAWGLTTLLDFYHLRPLASWRRYVIERGMSPWWDVADWIGGWPFEVATPEAVFRLYRDRGFRLAGLVTRQGYGCNEFVFVRSPD